MTPHITFKFYFGNSYNNGKVQTTQEMIDDFNNGIDIDIGSSFLQLQNGDTALNITTGEVVECKNDILSILYVNEGIKVLANQLQESRFFKENTAFKIIERTAKYDAYSDMYQMLRGTKGIHPADLEHIRLKAESHREYLAKQDVCYDYATQKFVPKVVNK